MPLYKHLERKKAELSKEDFEDYINYGKPDELKNETKWYSIEEFVALRPKQYSYITENDELNKEFKKEGKLMRAKGLNRESVKQYLTQEVKIAILTYCFIRSKNVNLIVDIAVVESFVSNRYLDSKLSFSSFSATLSFSLECKEI